MFKSFNLDYIEYDQYYLTMKSRRSVLMKLGLQKILCLFFCVLTITVCKYFTNINKSQFIPLREKLSHFLLTPFSIGLMAWISTDTVGLPSLIYASSSGFLGILVGVYGAFVTFRYDKNYKFNEKVTKKGG
jgi:hypothetical protein